MQLQEEQIHINKTQKWITILAIGLSILFSQTANAFEGNVRVIESGRTIHIIGDHKDNNIAIEHHGNNLWIEGGGTTVNGQDSVHISTSLDLKRIFIKLLGGDDRLSPSRIEDNVIWIIDMGSGDDLLNADECMLGGLKVNMGSGNDDADFFSSCEASAKIEIVGGDGQEDNLNFRSNIRFNSPRILIKGFESVGR